ncbi:protein kinase domain-containing protein [Bremerella sp. T1]|uniref:protein kinase domain-containing protein n=1 Tax=Bremerella sp. TYQ1 TaxID=3119568 RepID=UPI001CC9E98A|nr:protein kinase [Bremerella volcania]UBM33727.1 protein kinase [Bremerella volcania]
MDEARAKIMSGELIGSSVSGWNIISYLGSGKSALVFHARKDAQDAALKIFDPELVERFGKETQLSRIARECALIGESHPNLVEIFDGGECQESGHLFIAMQFLKARDLEKALPDVPLDKIASIVEQVAAAAKFLEDKELAHRDIKPSNIAVTNDFERAILLDLGVLRPFGDPSLTDEAGRPFIGTLRYSSPEFLRREEEDSIEGWRAITFYQLGGVLHDLITRRPLFDEFSEPYAVLVEAVKSEKPEIHGDEVSPDLVLLAQNCLVKSPQSRIALVSWDDFLKLTSPPKESAQSARDRVRKRSLSARVASDELTVGSNTSPPAQLTRQINDKLSGIVRLECAGNSAFPRMQIVELTGGQVGIHVVFDSNVTLMVPRQLSIKFVAEVIDEPTLSVYVSASACLLDGPNDHGVPPSECGLFRGPLDSSSLPTNVQNALYQWLDAVQSNNQGSHSSGNPNWLAPLHSTEEQS